MSKHIINVGALISLLCNATHFIASDENQSCIRTLIVNSKTNHRIVHSATSDGMERIPHEWMFAMRVRRSL